MQRLTLFCMALLFSVQSLLLSALLSETESNGGYAESNREDEPTVPTLMA